MVRVLLRVFDEPRGRLWVIGQPVNVALRDVGHLLARVAFLSACTGCF